MSKASSAVLICNGEAPSAGLARTYARKCGMIAAADGGANVARTLGIRPDVIVGDLDSIMAETRSFFSDVEMIQMTRQDNTDLEKALDLLAGRGMRSVYLLAAAGKRLDHTLGNLSVLWNYIGRLSIILLSDEWIGVPIHRRVRASAPVGTTVSLIPFGGCKGITLKGLEYPLANASMSVGEIGVSNVTVMPQFEVRVGKGSMFMMVLAHPGRVRILS